MAKLKDESIPTNLDIARKAIIKKYGEVISPFSEAGIADEEGNLILPTISTGSIGLDAAIGRGGFALGRIYEVFGAPSGGKCQSKDTYLNTEHGLLTIEELFSFYGTPVCISDKEVPCSCGLINKSGKLEKTSHFVWNGKRKVKRITTNLGFETESTYLHRYKVIDESTGFIVWRKTELIKKGDCVLISNKGYDIETDMVSENEATLLGMLIAEGCLGADNRLSFTNIDFDMRKLFSDLIGDIFNFSNIKYYDKDGHSVEIDDPAAVDCHVNSKDLSIKFHSNYDIGYVLAADKSVPIKIRMSSNKVVSKFLSAYFSLDGCYERSNRITASSASKILLRQIQLLLLGRFGIKSSIKSKFNKKYDRNYYYVDISGEDAAEFLDKIGFILNNKIEKLDNLGSNDDSSSNRWNYPHQNNLLRTLYDDTEYTTRVESGLMQHNFDLDRDQNLSFNTLNCIIDHFENMEKGCSADLILRHLKELSGYVCDIVVDVEDISNIPVFDVVMPETHSFVANGFVSHNTTLAMSVMAQALKRGMRCLYVDAEHSADPKLFEAMGVDLNKVEYLRAYSGDENLDALEIWVKSNAAEVAVIDSVAALIPMAESEAEIGKEQMGLHARLMSKAMRRLSQVAEKTKTLLIFINQTRYKIGAMGDPTTTTGGEALGFYSTGRILVSGGEFKSSRILDDAGRVIGHQTRFIVKKNKLAPPFREANIPLIYGVGYDIKWECLTLAEQLGIIDKAGSWYSYRGDRIGQGEKNSLEELKSDDDLFNSIYNEIIEITGLKRLYEQNGDLYSRNS